MWRVLIECVHGLFQMHEMGILHRDIKSANVFLIKPQHNENINMNEEMALKLGRKSSIGSQSITSRYTNLINQKGNQTISELESELDEKGQFLLQAKIGDMNVSKVLKAPIMQ